MTKRTVKGDQGEEVAVQEDDGQAETDAIDGGTVTVPNPDADLIDLIDEALHELGEPGDETPAPVANAVSLLRSAQAGLQAAGVEVVATIERTDEIEVHSPGEKVPTSGLYRPVGSEAALSKHDRFPPASMAFGWMLVQAAKQKGSKG